VELFERAKEKKMSILKRRWEAGMVIIAAALLLCGVAPALADDCGGPNLPGASVIAGVCEVPAGTYNITVASLTFDESVHMQTGALIHATNPALDSLTITIDGDLVMEVGSLIDGTGNADCFGAETPFTGRTVTIETTGLIDVKGSGANSCPLDNPATPLVDESLAACAVIQSNGCTGGDILIEAGTTANIDGLVLSNGTATGAGNVETQRRGGGMITIRAACELTVSDTGRVRSHGQDPGADLVHLEACTVAIYGLIESEGVGHAVPGTNNPNHCDSAFRPGHPLQATGCIEVWGSTVVIDSNAPHNGELSTDKEGQCGGRSWIEVFGRKDVTILGDNNTPFAVHANNECSNSQTAGDINIKSAEGNVSASGDAVQADATGAGGTGGEIHIEARVNVNLTGGSIFARGDFVANGGFGIGGKIGTAALPTRAFTGTLSWLMPGVGDVRPTGSGAPAASRGIIYLRDCLAPAGVNNATATYPFIGVTATTPTVLGDACDATGPTLPSYVSLPAGDCLAVCTPPAKKSGIKWNDANGNHVKDGLEVNIPGWPIHIFDKATGGVAFHQDTFTDGSGKYEFTVNPDPGGTTYIVCETVDPQYTQTFPQVGPDCGPLGYNHGGGVGWEVTLFPGDDDTGNDFGNHKETTVVCPEDPKAVLTRTVALAPLGGLPNHTSLQAAYDAAANGEVIGLFGKFTENVVLGDHDAVDGDKTLKITQCTSAQFTAADDSKPVFDITSSGVLTIVSPDSVNGSIGWRVASDGHQLKSIRANDSTGPGVLVLGNLNSISWNEVAGNAVGIQVEGGGNQLKGGTVQLNTGDGVWFTATAASNSLQGATVQLNGRNGVLLDGTLNLIKSNGRLNQNTLSGLAGAGSDNTIQSNAADDNSGSGFSISGPGNYFQDNKASKNTLFGFDISGGTSSKPNRLRSNASNNGSSGGSSENDGFEWQLLDYVKNESGGNKADGVGIPKTTVPTKCSQFPATNLTKNFAAAYGCGDGAD
jgi:hypothetical protein